MKPRAAALCMCMALLSAATPASAAAAPRFRHERSVTPAGPGPNRLTPDVALLAGAKPLHYTRGAYEEGLGDLRFYDSAGREIGYLVIGPPAPSERWQDGAVLPIASTRETSGFELDLGAPLLVDRLRLGDMPAPFLKRMRLEGSGDRRHWAILVADGTLFDLPEEGLKSTEVAFARGQFQYLRITWDDHKSAVVPPPPSASAHVVSTAPSPAVVRVPLSFDKRASEPGKSRFRIHLPGRHLPVVALELGCAGAHVLRTATVSEPRLRGAEVAPVPLGTHTLRRAVRGDLVASDLRIAIDRPDGSDLDLAIDDGDNPALELLAVEAELAPLPWIYFESAAGETLTARYGDPKLEAPRYDLEAMRESATAPAVDARWGEARDLAPPEEAPSSGDGIPATGAALEIDGFAYRRAIAAGPAGLTAVVLDGAVLAHSHELRDVRIADGARRQIPYLVERLDEPLSIDLPDPEPLPPPEDGGGARTSRYRIVLPFDSLPSARLVLATSGRVFDRAVDLSVQRPAPDARSKPWTEHVISARWRHADTEQRAPDLVLDLPPLAATAVELAVDEGDNSPLPIARPRLLLPAYRLRFFRADGAELTLLYGEPRLPAPRYDLALLAPRVLGETAREVRAGAETSAPPAPPRAGALTSAKVFWGALVLAVAVLLVIIVRLLGSDAPAGDASGPRGSTSS